MKMILFPLLLVPALVLGASVISSFDAPDTGITSLDWDGTNLWAVDGTTQYVYQLDPSNGDVLSSFLIVDQIAGQNPVPGGLAINGGTLFTAMYAGTAYGEIYKYDSGGSFQGAFDMYC